MKKFCYLLSALWVVVMVGCNNESTTGLDNVKDSEAPAELVRSYIEKDTYIDLDVKALAKNMSTPATRSSVSEEEASKMKAAVYRFYRHVTIEDDYYRCNLEGASDINVSQSVFDALKSNLESMNESIKKVRDEGGKIELAVPDSAYLESLLK